MEQNLPQAYRRPSTFSVRWCWTKRKERKLRRHNAYGVKRLEDRKFRQCAWLKRSWKPFRRRSSSLMACSDSFYFHTLYWWTGGIDRGGSDSYTALHSITRSNNHNVRCTEETTNAITLRLRDEAVNHRRAVVNITRKPCCLKETARCRSCSFRFKDRWQHLLQVYE